MITDKVRNDIAKLCLKPIYGRLSVRAKEEVAENFCKPKCGHGPEGKFCSEAECVYKGFLLLEVKTYWEHN